MKKILLFLLIAFTSIAAFAQEKYDEVLLTNGVEYSGKVTEINDKEVKFSHKGETLVYSIPKSNIFRIQFASGRTEIFTSIEKEGDHSNVITSTQAINKQMVAVLPFRFVTNKGFGSWEEMSYKIQQEAYVQAIASGSKMSFQSPAATNAILMKKGINPQQLRSYTMDEICNILGVGYVITGEVNIRTTGYVSTGTNNVYTKPKPGSTSTVVINTNQIKETYQTLVHLHIYNFNGAALYNRSKESVWNTPDAYKITLNYLLKRTPLQ